MVDLLVEKNVGRATVVVTSYVVGHSFCALRNAGYVATRIPL